MRSHHFPKLIGFDELIPPPAADATPPASIPPPYGELSAEKGVLVGGHRAVAVEAIADAPNSLAS